MIIKCKMCGGDLRPEENATTCECEFCGTLQTIPTIDNEKKLNLFNRAQRLLRACEFDKAAGVFESIVSEFPEEAEAYWGLVLCNYGIEYVDDPATGMKKPTCHRTLTTSIMDDINFEQACENADVIARRVYRDEAKAIDCIQKGILSIVANEETYDVFICYKEKDENGDRTEDSVLAQDIFDSLTAKGLKVFFARITLENVLGEEYEPHIYAALSSANVMIVVGTRFEYYDAVWVKNEWSRYLAMMQKTHSKKLVPCFKNLDAYDMPKEFKGLQAQDMGKLGWLQDLTRGVAKLCGRDEQQGTVREAVREVNNISGSAENLIKRAHLFLEDGNKIQAKEYVEKALDADAEYSPAYVTMVLINNNLSKEEDIASLRKSIDDDPYWQKAIRFANDEEKQHLEGYAKTALSNQLFDIEQRKREEELKQQQSVFIQAYEADQHQRLAQAIVLYSGIKSFKKSEERLNQCVEAYRSRRIEQMKERIEISRQSLPSIRENIRLYEKQIEETSLSIANALTEKNKVQARIVPIKSDIDYLKVCLSQVKGIFSGSKKRDLESQIRNLEGNLLHLNQELESAERILARLYKVKAEKKQYLLAAQDALKTALEDSETNTEERINEIKNWSLEDVIHEAEKELEKRKEEGLQKYRIASKYAKFGHYSSTASDKDHTEIEWLVLDVQEDKALLLSRYALDCKPYNMEYTYATWETCTLRTWLNNEFINKAFTSEEQKVILTTTVDNTKSQCYSGWNTNGGNNTQDKVFLLSYAEANKFLDVTASDRNNMKSRTSPTEYAIKQGAYTSNDYKTKEGQAACWWWLRSPGNNQYFAARVGSDGSLDYDSVISTPYVVRPALWIKLES